LIDVKGPKGINHGVRLVEVSDAESGQRLDNYLLRVLNGVPKTRIYKAVRKGEVRINKGRAKPETKLQAGDTVRIPPFQEAIKSVPKAASHHWVARLGASIVLETDQLLVINKPSGLAVHGGSGVNAGLIETLRLMYPEQRYLELVHRLDRDTSGLIMVAKRASLLRDLHAQLRGGRIDKRYQALVIGRWPAHLKRIDAPLEKFSLPSGERRVKVSGEGRRSLTEFRVLRRWTQATLVEAKPVTGRTHQIRVHCRHANMPILGEQKYETPESEILTSSLSVPRLFLHAAKLSFDLDGKRQTLEAPLPADLHGVCERLGPSL
jgi:23S rRNA pseudouridine955/2504/2580 synthase